MLSKSTVVGSIPTSPAMKDMPENIDYENFAVRLEGYIFNYIPSGWREPIGSVITKIRFSSDDIHLMSGQFKEGVLKKEMDEKYKKPVVTEAIMNFFEENF